MALIQQSFNFALDNNSDPDLCTFDGIDANAVRLHAISAFMLRVQVKSTNALNTAVVPKLYVDVQSSFASEVILSASSTWCVTVTGTPAEATKCSENKCAAAASFNANGDYTGDNTGSSVTLSNGQVCEWQWSLRPMVLNRTLYFRVKRRVLTVDNVLDSYVVTPAVLVLPADNQSYGDASFGEEEEG